MIYYVIKSVNNFNVHGITEKIPDIKFLQQKLLYSNTLNLKYGKQDSEARLGTGKFSLTYYLLFLIFIYSLPSLK